MKLWSSEKNNDMYSNTDIKTIIKSIGELNQITQIPAIVPGGEHFLFGIEHRRVLYKQIVLIAYEIDNNGYDIIARYEWHIKEKLGNHVTVLPYPFADEEGVKTVLKELSNYLNCPIDDSQIIKKLEHQRKESQGFYLFITIIPSSYYS